MTVTGSVEEYRDLVEILRESTRQHNDQVITTNLASMLKLADWAISTSRLNSIWPFSFGLACCAIEMMAAGASRFDLDRFGAGAFRGTPRQSDPMIVAGTVTYKMGLRIERLRYQMPEPRWVIAMGACAASGGPYDRQGYHVMKGVDLIIPVHVYTPGCPPRPESLLESLICLQDMIRSGRDREIRLAWERQHESRKSFETAGAAESAPGIGTGGRP